MAGAAQGFTACFRSAVVTVMTVIMFEALSFNKCWQHFLRFFGLRYGGLKISKHWTKHPDQDTTNNVAIDSLGIGV